MGKSLDAYLKMEIISKNATKDEVMEVLSNLTDCDFNGEDGGYSVEINGEEMSRLEAHMLEFNENEDLEMFIRDVLKDNYSDEYYDDYSCEILEVGDKLVVGLSYI